MNRTYYHIVVHIFNVILLGLIGLFWVLTTFNISPHVDARIDNLFKYSIFGFMLVLWAVNYWFQYKSKKKKWILPLAGTVLYVAIVFFFLRFVFPFIRISFFS